MATIKGLDAEVELNADYRVPRRIFDIKHVVAIRQHATARGFLP